MENLPISLQRVIKRESYLEHAVRGLPNLGSRPDNNSFSSEVLKIYNAFELYGNNLYQLENDRIKGLSSRSLGGGSPMKTPSFPLCKEAMVNAICEDDFSDYPMAAGDEESRKQISEYLKREGFDFSTLNNKNFEKKQVEK